MGKKKKAKAKKSQSNRKRVRPNKGRRGPSTKQRVPAGPHCWTLNIGGRTEPPRAFHCVWINGDKDTKKNHDNACRALSQKCGIQGPTMLRFPERDKVTP